MSTVRLMVEVLGWSMLGAGTLLAVVQWGYFFVVVLCEYAVKWFKLSELVYRVGKTIADERKARKQEMHP